MVLDFVGVVVQFVGKYDVFVLVIWLQDVLVLLVKVIYIVSVVGVLLIYVVFKVSDVKVFIVLIGVYLSFVLVLQDVVFSGVVCDGYLVIVGIGKQVLLDVVGLDQLVLVEVVGSGDRIGVIYCEFGVYVLQIGELFWLICGNIVLLDGCGVVQDFDGQDLIGVNVVKQGNFELVWQQYMVWLLVLVGVVVFMLLVVCVVQVCCCCKFVLIGY